MEGCHRLMRVYTLNRVVHWSIFGLLFPIIILMILEKGLDLFQAGVVFSTYSAAIILLELPTGGLSDTIGRKKVYLASMAANLLGVVVVILSWEFYTVAAGFLFLGVGRALASGSIDAWFIDEYHRINGESGLQKAIAKVEVFVAIGIATSSIIGGLLPMTLGPLTAEVRGWDIYTGNLLIIAMMIVLQTILTQRLVVEELDGSEESTALSGLRKLPQVLASSMEYGVRNRIILLLLAGMVVFGFGLSGVELLWQPKLKDIIGNDSDTWIFGLVSAGYFLMGVAGNIAVTPLCRRLNENYVLALFLIRLMVGAMLFSLALQEGAVGFVLFFLLVFMFNSMETSPRAVILNSEVPKEKRSTILSFESLVFQLGVIAGKVTMGYISNTYSIGSAWTVGAALVFISCSVFVAPSMVRKGRDFVSGKDIEESQDRSHHVL